MVGQCFNHWQLGGFHWVELRKDWNPKTIVDELAAKKNYGYLLEVYVAYLKELHDYHKGLPFKCTKMKIDGVEKLVSNLYYKKKYVIHIKALKAINHGLVLERIHRCIEFKQISLDEGIHRFQHEIELQPRMILKKKFIN